MVLSASLGGSASHGQESVLERRGTVLNELKITEKVLHTAEARVDVTIRNVGRIPANAFAVNLTLTDIEGKGGGFAVLATEAVLGTPLSPGQSHVFSFDVGDVPEYRGLKASLHYAVFEDSSSVGHQGDIEDLFDARRAMLLEYERALSLMAEEELTRRRVAITDSGASFEAMLRVADRLIAEAPQSGLENSADQTAFEIASRHAKRSVYDLVAQVRPQGQRAQLAASKQTSVDIVRQELLRQSRLLRASLRPQDLEVIEQLAEGR